MDEIKPDKKHITLSLIVRWTLGLLFLLASLGAILGENYLAGIFLVISVFILIPPFAEYIEDKLNFTMSGPVRSIIVICLFFGFAVFMPHTTPTHTQSSLHTSAAPSSEQVANVVATPAAVQAAPQIVAKWTGSAIKNTETFHISSNEWSIAWDTKPGKDGNGNFAIFVYNADGSYKELVANVIGANNDHTIIRGSGDYYLKINTGQPYVIQVEQ